MLEETGYDVALGRLLGVDTLVVPPEQRTVRPGPVLQERPGDLRGRRSSAAELRNEVDGTTDEARWFPLSEVADLARVDLVDIGLQMRTA